MATKDNYLLPPTPPESLSKETQYAPAESTSTTLNDSNLRNTEAVLLEGRTVEMEQAGGSITKIKGGGVLPVSPVGGLRPGFYDFVIGTRDKTGGITYHNFHIEVRTGTGNIKGDAQVGINDSVGILGQYEETYTEVLGGGQNNGAETPA